jgi:hypothetical protein
VNILEQLFPNINRVACASVMAEEVTNGEHAVDLEQTRKSLLTNSTKQRTSELLSLQNRIEGR